MDTQKPPAIADCAQFSRFAELQIPVVYRFFLASMKDRDLAETLTQECFLKAYRNRLGFRGECSAKTWVLRIAINLWNDYWRSRRSRFWRETQLATADVDVAGDSFPSAERSPEAQVLLRELTAKISTLVETLSKRERKVFLLRYVEEFTLREIGERTGLKVGAVKVYLSRALRKIRAALASGKSD